ncbi:MAG: lactoylglutathione lyase [Smithella sp.]|nr:lactoylglutathione lyase [Smithella sp.]
MQFTFAHNNFNVLDLEKSLAFYKEALQLKEVRRYESPDGSFILVFLGDERTSHQLELTWMKDRTEPYSLGDNEFHLAFKVDDFAAAHALHEKMGCICFENKSMGIYFIHDPDDYWIEIIPKKR